MIYEILSLLCRNCFLLTLKIGWHFPSILEWTALVEGKMKVFNYIIWRKFQQQNSITEVKVRYYNCHCYIIILMYVLIKGLRQFYSTMFQLFSKSLSVTERGFQLVKKYFLNAKPMWIFCKVSIFLGKTNSNIFRLRYISSILNYPGDNLTYRHQRGIFSSLHLTEPTIRQNTDIQSPRPKSGCSYFQSYEYWWRIGITMTIPNDVSHKSGIFR